MSESVAKSVVVACKLPHGIKIRDYEEGSANELVMGGGTRKVKVFRPVGPTYRIKGPNVPDALRPMVEVIGGYAITQGMPADVFERWMKSNKDSLYVKNELIFGDESGDTVRGKARELANKKTGLEPLDTKMKLNDEGRMQFVDERLKQRGLNQVVDGALELTPN